MRPQHRAVGREPSPGPGHRYRGTGDWKQIRFERGRVRADDGWAVRRRGAHGYAGGLRARREAVHQDAYHPGMGSPR
jgi:hypothetical protein